MPALIGIDLGTTHSLCATFRDGQPVLIPNAQGEFLTPSIVGVLDSGQVVVGAAARELRVTRPETCASTFKRWMGTDQAIDLAGKPYSAAELSSLVLRALKADAEAFLGEEVTEAVITVPAYFNDLQRKMTQAAGELAGFDVRRIVNEPTAAALTYGFHDRDSERRLLVFDLGGGTFDVTVLEIFDGTLEILSTSGESHLGGEDFTDRLARWVIEREGLAFETTEFREPRRVARLRQECERAKRRLGDAESAEIRWPEVDGTFADDARRYSISRGAFRELVDVLLRRLDRPVERALRDADLTSDAIDDIVFVGGATRMPIVRERVAERFGREPLVRHDPDQVVALGAAVQAALIADDRAVDDMVMTDVCPYTLGIGITKIFGNQERDGYYLPIIDRSTTIPVSREEIVSTLRANQRVILVKVYQGEDRRVEQNLLLGELEVTGIPSGPAGQEVHVRFTYDLNGILEVEAFVPKTGKKFQTVIAHRTKGLSRSEIARAVKKMQKLKFYPRDDLRNRELVLFCERVVGEVSPYERQPLEEAIDTFEQSMASGSPEYFETARQQLLIQLSRLGHPYELVEDETRDVGDE